MRRHTWSELLPTNGVIRDLQNYGLTSYPAMTLSGYLSAMSGNVLCEKETKSDVEEAIALGGAA
jgi:hypothetical protein